MRPRLEIRTALAQAARALHAEQGPATWQQIAARAQVGAEKARMTVQDMRRAGELQRVDTVQVAHTRTPMARYAPHPSWGSASDRPATLDDLLRTWRS